MDEKTLLEMLTMQKKVDDVRYELTKMLSKGNEDDYLGFNEGHLLTAIFVLERFSKEYGRKIDDIIF